MDWFQTDNGVILAKHTIIYESASDINFSRQADAAVSSAANAQKDIAETAEYYAKWKFDYVAGIYCDNGRGYYYKRAVDTLESNAEVEALALSDSNNGIPNGDGTYCYQGKGVSYLKYADKPQIKGTTCQAYDNTSGF